MIATNTRKYNRIPYNRNNRAAHTTLDKPREAHKHLIEKNKLVSTRKIDSIRSSNNLKSVIRKSNKKKKTIGKK